MAELNRVVAGDYSGSSVLWDGKDLVISGLMKAKCKLDKSTVLSYSLVNSAHGLFKPSCHTVSVDFTDGKRSLLSLSPGFYERLIRILF